EHRGASLALEVLTVSMLQLGMVADACEFVVRFIRFLDKDCFVVSALPRHTQSGDFVQDGCGQLPPVHHSAQASGHSLFVWSVRVPERLWLASCQEDKSWLADDASMC
ncbi:MAG: hypothetical protein ACKPKO_61430, partial [Candidatus Fonsibacter sp.]